MKKQPNTDIECLISMKIFNKLQLWLVKDANNQNGKDGFFHEGGGLGFHIPILKNDFFENHLESFHDCENVFCT